jgi:phenol 2-monooxygenase
MQFYKDGFRGGNPDVKQAAPNRRNRGVNEPLPEKVDVLIAGTGPAGLCLAAQLAQFPEIETMIVERMPTNIIKGKADGINTRTMEMFQAFGFADKVKRETYWVNQTNFWMPDPANPAHIKRVGRVQDVADDSSEMPHILINQARLHELFLEVMRTRPRAWSPTTAGRSWPDGGPDHRRPPGDRDPQGRQRRELVGHPHRARQLRGGLRRRPLGGAQVHRRRAARRRRAPGLGRDGHPGQHRLPRRAAEVPDLLGQRGQRADPAARGRLRVPHVCGAGQAEARTRRPPASKFTQDDMIAAANRIIRPYSIDVKEIVWWSIYDIGHSITDKFDDVAEGSDRNPRVFTAGDACHTHSPKAGQGMNVSMQDTFNLGWKLVHVLQGRADASLLRTYSKERLTEAKRLVETDHEWARIMSAPTTQAEREGRKSRASSASSRPTWNSPAAPRSSTTPRRCLPPRHAPGAGQGEEIGRRFHSAPVVRLSDAKQMQLGHVAEADARWRLYAFAGRADSSAPGSAIHRLADWLETTRSPVVKHTRPGEDMDAVIDFRAVFQQTFDQLAYEHMPSLLQAQDRQAGPAGPREGVLRRPQGCGRHLRHARHRPRAGLHGRGAPGPVHRACAAAGRVRGAVGLLCGDPALSRMQSEEDRVLAWRSAVQKGNAELDRGEGMVYTAQALGDITQAAIHAMHSGQPMDREVLP